MKRLSKHLQSFKSITALLAFFGFGVAVAESTISSPLPDKPKERGVRDNDRSTPAPEAISLSLFSAQEYELVDAPKIIELGDSTKAKTFLCNLKLYLSRKDAVYREHLSSFFSDSLRNLASPGGSQREPISVLPPPDREEFYGLTPTRQDESFGPVGVDPAMKPKEIVIQFKTLNRMMSLVNANNPTPAETDSINYIKAFLAKCDADYRYSLRHPSSSQMYSSSSSPSPENATGVVRAVSHEVTNPEVQPQPSPIIVINNNPAPSENKDGNPLTGIGAMLNGLLTGIGAMLSGLAALWAVVFRREQEAGEPKPRYSRTRHKKHPD